MLLALCSLTAMKAIENVKLIIQWALYRRFVTWSPLQLPSKSQIAKQCTGLLSLKTSSMVPAWHLIGPFYSTSTIFVRQTGFALHQTVYWFNKLSIDSKRLGMFLYCVSVCIVCPFSLGLTFKISILFVMADKALKGWSFLDSGLLSTWQSALDFPLYADIGPLCH